MKFRFKSEDFLPILPLDTRNQAADIANALLEAEEAKCAQVFGHCIQCRPTQRWYRKMWHGSKSPHGKPTHTALLWNVEEIGE